jgi:propanediol utilization protein
LYEVTVSKTGEVSGRMTILGERDVSKVVPEEDLEQVNSVLRPMTYYYKAPEVSIVGETGAPQKVIEDLVKTCLRAHISKIGIHSKVTTPGWNNFDSRKKKEPAGAPKR